MSLLKRIEDNDGWRWYSTTDELNNEMYAGVTGILDIAVPQKLKKYFVNNSKNKQEKTLAHTADIGTRIHDLIEKDLKGELSPFEITDDIKEPFERWLELKKENNIIAQSTEQRVCSNKYGFAGTLDIIGEFKGKPCVMDVKTGFYSVKAGWQMAAYRQAAIEMNKADQNYGIVGLSVPRDGGAPRPFVYEHIDWCIKSFLACLETWKGLYFTKLNRLDWKWLHKSSLEVSKC